MGVRQQLAHLLLGLSSFCKFLGVLVIPREKTIVVDTLTLPGWFIIDDCIYKVAPFKSKKLKSGTEWLYWPMPDLWCKEMSKLKSASKRQER